MRSNLQQCQASHRARAACTRPHSQALSARCTLTLCAICRATCSSWPREPRQRRRRRRGGWQPSRRRQPRMRRGGGGRRQTGARLRAGALPAGLAALHLSPTLCWTWSMCTGAGKQARSRQGVGGFRRQHGSMDRHERVAAGAPGTGSSPSPPVAHRLPSLAAAGGRSCYR